MPAPSLVASASLREFFRGLLTEVMRRQQLDVQETTEFYLVNLLSEFADVHKLFTDEDGRPQAEPLAFLYRRALEQERAERVRTLRRLGDVSLYRAGFFSPSLRESGVGPDYYIQMGEAAYGHLADLSTQSTFSSVYRELQSKFPSLVEVLEEMAARGFAAAGPRGALQVYEAWTRTGSERLERVLVEVGLVPDKGGLPN